MSAYKITEHKYDMVVVGAGGAGLRATFGLASANTAITRPLGVNHAFHCQHPDASAATSLANWAWAKATASGPSSVTSAWSGRLKTGGVVGERL